MKTTRLVLALALAAACGAEPAEAQLWGGSGGGGGGGGGDTIAGSCTEIVDEIETCDGTGSGLDADTVDGVHATGLCQLAGNGLCNMTGTVTYTNADGTADINSGSGTKLHLASVGSAPIVLQSGSGNIVFGSAAQPERVFLFNNTAQAWLMGSTDNPAARIGSTANGHFFFGKTGDANATTVIAAASDGADSSVSAGTLQHTWYGEGKSAVARRQSVACAAGVLALDPTSDVVNIDANGAACVVTLGKANAILGSQVRIHIVTASAGGGVTFPDVASTAVNDAVCDTTGLQIHGLAICEFVDLATDMYVCKCFP